MLKIERPHRPFFAHQSVIHSYLSIDVYYDLKIEGDAHPRCWFKSCLDVRHSIGEKLEASATY